MIFKRGSAVGVVFIFILVILLGLALYVLYLNWPGDPRGYDIIRGVDENIVYSESEQFFENLRYRDRRISYKIESACDSEKARDAERAFGILEEKTILDFYPSLNDDPEITIFCTNIAPEASEEGYFVAGEGGPTEVINASKYGVIFVGQVSFFREDKCDEPNVASHEILHALGFDHNNNPKSVLFPTLDCDQSIDESIINSINNLYSVDSLPDLKINDVSVRKSGIYMNFEIEVINQGLKDAKNVDLSLYADGRFIKDFELNSIDIGIKKSLEVTNLKIFKSAKKITFRVDSNDNIKEIIEDNNDIDLVLQDN